MLRFLEYISHCRSNHEAKDSESPMPGNGVRLRYVPALTRPGSTPIYHNINFSVRVAREALIAKHGGWSNPWTGVKLYHSSDTAFVTRGSDKVQVLIGDHGLRSSLALF